MRQSSSAASVNGKFDTGLQATLFVGCVWLRPCMLQAMLGPHSLIVLSNLHTKFAQALKKPGAKLADQDLTTWLTLNTWMHAAHMH